MLVDRYGAQVAYLLLAGGFTVIGAAGPWSPRQGAGGRSERGGEPWPLTPWVVKEVAMQAPLALLAPRWRARWVRRQLGLRALLGRNLPLVLLLVIAGFLLWPHEPAARRSRIDGARASRQQPTGPRPNGAYTDGGEAHA